MLYELRHEIGSSLPTFTAHDVTLVVALRLHDNNSWVADRLRMLVDYYTPSPRVVVVDFGSAPAHAATLRELCELGAFELVRSEDDGVFSLAASRNLGARAAKSALVFFSDIDCLGPRDLFAQLARFAAATDMRAVFDRLAVLPVYHLATPCTLAITGAADHAQRERELERALTRAVFEADSSTVDYIDPQSNFFLLRRDFFEYVGGYNEAFRGHGSEDFEFMVRVAHYSTRFPLPERLLDNRFGPRSEEYGTRGEYTGFRRLCELMAVEAELAGLRIAHLDHPRGLPGDSWTSSGDRGRARFHEQVARFIGSRIGLLSCDWLPRERSALVIVKHASHADFAFPLRLAGYRLEHVDASDTGIEAARARIAARTTDSVVIFNPYMKSHSEFAPLVAAARAASVELLVVERGALPDSWYYATDLSYRDPDYASLPARSEDFSEVELAEAARYVRALRGGEFTLEKNGAVQLTTERVAAARRGYTRVCVIPLQLPDDVAVTHFNEEYGAYVDFVAQIDEVAHREPATLFWVKPHPLSKTKFVSSARNVRIGSVEDNIHALLDQADLVVCYNSGVGLLALIHECPLITTGNAFYNRGDERRRAKSLATAFASLSVAPPSAPSAEEARLLVAWLIHRKYSFFRGRSVIRDLGTRRSHDYRELLFYRLRGPLTLDVRQSRLDATPDSRSHGVTRLGLRDAFARGGTEFHAPELGAVRSPAYAAKLRKLARDPARFLRDARSPALRWLSRRWPGKARCSLRD